MRGIRIFFLFVIFAIFVSCAGEKKEKNLAVQGIIHYEKDNPDQILALNGQWEMYWEKLYSPSDFKLKNTTPPSYFELPNYWNGLEVNGKSYYGNGFATFRLKIIGKDTNAIKLLSIKEILSAYKVWFNGTQITEMGHVGSNAEESKPRYVPISKALIFNNDTNELIIQVSNFHHRKGGFFEEILIGEEQALSRKNVLLNAFDAFLFGSLLIMAIYHFGLFIFRRKEKSTLFFGLLTLLVGLRVLLTKEQFISTLFPGLSWEACYKLEYITLFIAPVSFMTFFQMVFYEDISKRIVRIFQFIGLALTVLVFVAPARIYSHTTLAYQAIILIGILIVMYSLFKALIKKRDGALFLFAGILALLLATVNDILYIQSVINTIELTSVGLFTFILFQSFVLSKRFYKAFSKNEELTLQLEFQNKNLENIVNERTAEIINQKEEIIAQRDQLEQTNIELEKLSIVASETDNAVLIAQTNGELEWVNAGFTKLYGFTINEFIKHFGSNIIKSSSYSGINDAVAYSLKEKKSVVYSTESLTKNGEKIWVQTTLTPIQDQNGKTIKLVAIDSDITKIKMAEFEILQQKEELHAQSELLSKINKELEGKNIQITDSIEYAKLIQEAYLPSLSTYKQLVSDYYILFYPRNIVSGDIYWIAQSQSKIISVVADCTGHGVPGGFMSMITMTLLNEIVKIQGITEPDKILLEMNKGIINAFGKTADYMSSFEDGAEMSVVCIDKENKIIESAGAGLSVLISHNNKLDELAGNTHYYIGDALSIGRKVEFKVNKLSYSGDVIIYQYTDGFSDQFGGPEEWRFMFANFKSLISENMNRPLKEQHDNIFKSLNNWMNAGIDKFNQTDDITVVALQV